MSNESRGRDVIIAADDQELQIVSVRGLKYEPREAPPPSPEGKPDATDLPSAADAG